MVSGGEGSSMNLLAQGNTLTNTSPRTAGINLWNGTLAATVDHTLFTANGGGNTGLLINNASTSALSTITMTNSGFLSTGAPIRPRIVTLGPAQVNFSNNNAEWDAANGFGYRMSLGASSTVNVASNTFTDTVGGATGLLFDSLTGPGNVTINNNLMNMFNSGTDKGIYFSSITNTIQLSGTDDNRIYNAATPFFVPFGTTTGGFFVNGSVKP